MRLTCPIWKEQIHEISGPIVSWHVERLAMSFKWGLQKGLKDFIMILIPAKFAFKRACDIVGTRGMQFVYQHVRVYCDVIVPKD